MRITIYKSYNDYIGLDFPPCCFDNIKQQCYSIGIKWYTISYTDKEMTEYERLFKDIIKETGNEYGTLAKDGYLEVM